MHDVIVANGQWHGGAMWLAPEAKPDDGLFDVVLIGDVTKRDFVTTAPKIYKGTYLAHPKVELLRSRTVAVDGARAPADRARRRAGRNDAGALRDRPGCAARACPGVAPHSCLACAFAALAGLVAAGSFTRIDQWAVDHAMPGGELPPRARAPLIDGLVPLLHAHWGSPYAIAANIVTLPGVVSHRARDRLRLLAAPRGALVAAVAVEVLCKELLDRPALHDGSFHIASFDSSFPSGHALRTVLVAGAVASTLAAQRARPQRRGRRLRRAARARRLAHAERPRRRVCPRRASSSWRSARLRRLEPEAERRRALASLSTLRSSAASALLECSRARARASAARPRASRVAFNAPTRRSPPGASLSRCIASSLRSASLPSRSFLRVPAMGAPYPAR